MKTTTISHNQTVITSQGNQLFAISEGKVVSAHPEPEAEQPEEDYATQKERADACIASIKKMQREAVAPARFAKEVREILGLKNSFTI